MVGNIERMNGGMGTKGSGDRENHIRNRRLFNLAAGIVALAEWERDHLHKCVPCQAMGYVLIRSISRLPDLEFKHGLN